MYQSENWLWPSHPIQHTLLSNCFSNKSFVKKTSCSAFVASHLYFTVSLYCVFCSVFYCHCHYRHLLSVFFSISLLIFIQWQEKPTLMFVVHRIAGTFLSSSFFLSSRRLIWSLTRLTGLRNLPRSASLAFYFFWPEKTKNKKAVQDKSSTTPPPPPSSCTSPTATWRRRAACCSQCTTSWTSTEVSWWTRMEEEEKEDPS